MKTAYVFLVLCVVSVALSGAQEEPATAGCRTACIEIYQPLCGMNCQGQTKTFGNQCEMDSYNCLNPSAKYNLAYKGECN